MAGTQFEETTLIVVVVAAIAFYVYPFICPGPVKPQALSLVLHRCYTVPLIIVWTFYVARNSAGASSDVSTGLALAVGLLYVLPVLVAPVCRCVSQLVMTAVTTVVALAVLVWYPIAPEIHDASSSTTWTTARPVVITVSIVLIGAAASALAAKQDESGTDNAKCWQVLMLISETVESTALSLIAVAGVAELSQRGSTSGRMGDLVAHSSPVLVAPLSFLLVLARQVWFFYAARYIRRGGGAAYSTVG